MSAPRLLEKDIEEILYKHHSHFIEPKLIPTARQLTVAQGRVDLVFTDRFGDQLLVEVKRGSLTRDAIAQLIDYLGNLSLDNQRSRLMIIAESIAGNWKNALDRQGIEYREYIERDYLEFLERNDVDLLTKILDTIKLRALPTPVNVNTLSKQNITIPQSSIIKNVEGIKYWIIPFTDYNSLNGFIIKGKCWGYGDRTPGRGKIKPGDWACFYLSKIGVIAHAKVATFPSKVEHEMVKNPEKYPWIFQLSDIKVYDKNPVKLDNSLRAKLEAFKGKSQASGWGWFVQNNHFVSKADFDLLTRDNL